MKIKFEGPMMIVEDIVASQAFYEKVLQQKVIMDLGECKAFDGGLIILEKEIAGTMFQYPKEKLLRDSVNVALYFEVDDFDSFLNRLAQYPKIQYVHDVITFNWGQRSISFYDIDKHLIDVSETMETVFKRYAATGMSAQEVATKTQLPIAMVEEALAKK